MYTQGEIISYIDMCKEEGVNLQRGMNFRLKGGYSVILMSQTENAPYKDYVQDNGRILIYEGHDLSKKGDVQNPKEYDQPMHNPGGTLTQNGSFYEAALNYKNKGSEPELVKVYEKIKPSIWVFNGIFKLSDAWLEESKDRKVFKFKLQLEDVVKEIKKVELDHDRLIPSDIKRKVWIRDGGKCVKCGSPDNLHFDHIIPYSKGGSSLVEENIQIMCARHNLQKRDKIE